MATPPFLDNAGLQLLLFGGKGGVGKTTCAAASALHLARCFPRVSFLLVSIDPAHSLADSLADLVPPANLKILEINAQQCLWSFKLKHRRQLREIALRGTFLDEEDINGFLGLSLPGMDELMAFLEISSWVANRDYDCLIVDTAPTEHSIRLLAMPGLLQKWLGALNALLAKHRYLRARFSPCATADETDHFVDGLAASVSRMEGLLQDPARCRFVPVMLAETLSIRETCSLLQQLKRLHVSTSDIVVNRLVPPSACLTCAEVHARQATELATLFGDLPGFDLWGVPLYPSEVRGRESLEAFWKNVGKLQQPAAPAPAPQAPHRPVVVEGGAEHPAPELRLLLFAGKGGVGKTTLACATALRLAGEFPAKKILLFSAAPAQSLAASLGLPVGPTPTPVFAGLSAVQIDAQGEFDALKRLYQEELGEFLRSLLPHADLAFDREVMERMLDLSPPGLDEVMALAGLAELLARNAYDVIVLDSAPTGHMIRLLELPQLIDQWLKVAFGIFLKYKRLFRLPGMTERLVRMSKGIKQLRGLLSDPRRSVAFAVTILTQMAFEETSDLLAACDRMGLAAPGLFLNLATPPGPCPLCSSLRRGEQEIRRQFRAAFPDRRQTLVYRQGEPRGLRDLQRLGETLYAAACGEKDREPCAARA
jgi:arsenite-transporting ATPase